MSLISTILRRLVLLVFVVAGVAIITFTISHLIPGDPAQLIAGDKASAQTLAHVRQELGLDKPVTQQFVI